MPLTVAPKVMGVPGNDNMSGFWKTVLIVWLVSYAICVIDAALRLHHLERRGDIVYHKWLKNVLKEFFCSPFIAILIVGIWALDLSEWITIRHRND